MTAKRHLGYISFIAVSGFVGLLFLGCLLYFWIELPYLDNGSREKAGAILAFYFMLAPMFAFAGGGLIRCAYVVLSEYIDARNGFVR